MKLDILRAHEAIAAGARASPFKSMVLHWTGYPDYEGETVDGLSWRAYGGR